MYDCEKLKKLLLKYSFSDLLQSFFVLDLWLPNITSPIKIQYLYVFLESIWEELSAKKKINSYKDFEIFCRKLFILLPSFEIIEDYVPEADWGEVKYFLDNKRYKIFYGSEISNSYDFYYSFEIIHKPFEKIYHTLINRCPILELRFCLETQDYILNNLKQSKNVKKDVVKPGDINIPSSKFWQNCYNFIEQYQPENIHDINILFSYTKKIEKPIALPSLESFIENAYLGRNCKYFFIKKSNKYYPVLPRRWFSVFYDIWGALLENNYKAIYKYIGDVDPSMLIGIELSQFLKDRIYNKNIFTIVAPLGNDNKPPNELWFTLVMDGEKLVLFYTAPPVFNADKTCDYLKKISIKLRESIDLMNKEHLRFGLLEKQQVLEIKTKKEDNPVEPMLIIVLPTPQLDIIGSIAKPNGVKAEIVTLDQIVGIFDEIESQEELSDFLNYFYKIKKDTYHFNSLLDIFGSFKDSKGVLVPGAIEPNKIILYCHWGSEYRYKSLKKFWALFPLENFCGHPRSWKLLNNEKLKNGLILYSRTFFWYAYYQIIGRSSIFINSPANLLEHNDIWFNDDQMHSLFDAINTYKNIIKKLNFTKSRTKIRIFFCPLTLVENSVELFHLKHLAKNTALWSMDCLKIDAREYAIRIVYNQEGLLIALKDILDRSIQVQLLIDVLEQLNIYFSDSKILDIKSILNKEKKKKARFRTFIVEKRFSFPEGIGVVLPEQREYKLADKEIAKTALALKIIPGTYSFEEGKKKLNLLRSKIVELLNTKLQQYVFKDTIIVLLEKSNALLHDCWRTKIEINAAHDLEVEYDRSERLSEKEKNSIHWYRVYKYLIEKLVSLQPIGKNELDNQMLKELLALVNRLYRLYGASDFINYEIYPVEIIINQDYIVSTRYKGQDIGLMGEEYSKEKAKINLGIIGDKNDAVESSLPINDYLDEIDNAFEKDFNFRFKTFIKIQKIFIQWADYAQKEEQACYFATKEEIDFVCKKSIIDYEPLEISSILNFLTLKPEKILMVKGNSKPTEDVPIWEHYKRLMHFDIRPLIKIENRYYWASHSIDRSCKIWIDIPYKHKLPADFEAPAVKAILKKGHKDLSNCLVKKIEEIVLRNTLFVKKNVFPHKYDKIINNIGDYDILAYSNSKNILINIESKIIDTPYSNKDSGRVQRKIFGEKKENGFFKEGYLQKAEKRAQYLDTKASYLLEKICWKIPMSNPKIISLFVTQKGFWWTKFPPVITKVHFVEVELLNEFIKNL